jgi:hypothetical protein
MEYIHGIEPLGTFDDLDSDFLSQVIGKYARQLSSDQIVSAPTAQYNPHWFAGFPRFWLGSEAFIETAG